MPDFRTSVRCGADVARSLPVMPALGSGTFV